MFRGSRYDSKAPYMVNSHGTPHSIDLETKVLSSLKTEEPLFKSIKDLSPLKKTSKLKPRPIGAEPFFIEPLKRFKVNIIYELNHRQLAMFIKKQENYKKGQPVMLFACNTGKRNDGIAQKLANKLGVPVQAPTGPIWNAYYEPYFKKHVPAKVTIDIPEFIVENKFIKSNNLAKYLIDKIKYPGDEPRKYFQGKIKTFYPGKPIYSGKGRYSGGYSNKLDTDVVFYGAIIGGAIGVTGLVAQSLSLLDNDIPLHYHKLPSDKYVQDYNENELKILEAINEKFLKEIESKYASTQFGENPQTSKPLTITTMAPGSEFIYPALEERSFK